MSHWVAFVAGIFVGTFVGMFVLALAIVAGERGERARGAPAPRAWGRGIIPIAGHRPVVRYRGGAA